MSVKSNTQLAAFFETGDQPSETEFGHLVDTILPPATVLTGTGGPVALTAATHAYRDLVVGVVSGGLASDLTLTLPTTIVTDEWYHILFFGDLSDNDTHDLKILTGTQGSHFFYGNVNSFLTVADSSGGALISAAQGNGPSNDVFNCNTNAAADIWIRGKSSTEWFIWGNTIGGTATTIGDALT